MLFDPRWRKHLDAISPPPNAVQRVLMQAKAAIEQHGWVQNRFGTTEVGFCTAGAMHRALRDSDEGGAADSRVALRAVFGSPHQMIDWNDAPNRTKQEVLAKFDEAIKWAGAKKESADVA